MSEWDKLQEKMKTPDQKQAETEARDQRERREAYTATSQALVTILQAFRKAQIVLAKRFGSNVTSGQHGEDSFLEFPGHKLSANRAGQHGTEIVFAIDGQQIHFSYRDGFFVAERLVPMLGDTFDGFVAKQVSALVQ